MNREKSEAKFGAELLDELCLLELVVQELVDAVGVQSPEFAVDVVGALEEPNDIVVLLHAVLVKQSWLELAERLAVEWVKRELGYLFE